MIEDSQHQEKMMYVPLLFEQQEGSDFQEKFEMSEEKLLCGLYVDVANEMG